MKPFALIEAALRQAGLEREAVERIAVGLGPAPTPASAWRFRWRKGWQLATGVKLLRISSAESIAAQAAVDGTSGKFSVVIDAQRGNFISRAMKFSRALRGKCPSRCGWLHPPRRRNANAAEICSSARK